jgi:hypothetical protein
VQIRAATLLFPDTVVADIQSMSRPAATAIALSVLSAALLARPAVAQRSAGRRTPALVGLTQVVVVVDEAESLTSDQEAIVDATVASLREAGIEVLELERLPELPKRRIPAMLHVSFDTLPVPPDNNLYAFLVRVRLLEDAQLARNSKLGVFAPTWEQVKFGTVGAGHVAALRGSVQDLVNEFVKDYAAANR